MKPAQWAVLVVMVVLSLAVAVQTVRLEAAQHDVWVADTTARNERARHDTTRQQIVELRGEAVAVAGRLAEQADARQALETDTTILARALRQASAGETNALALVRLLGDSIRRIQTGTATAGGDSVTATDSVESAGVRVQATVTVQGVQATRPPPLIARWDWQLERAPTELGISFECQGKDAAVQVAGPSWATFQISRAVQSATFCNPEPRFMAFSFRPPSLPWTAALLGAGGLLGWLAHP